MLDWVGGNSSFTFVPAKISSIHFAHLSVYLKLGKGEVLESYTAMCLFYLQIIGKIDHLNHVGEMSN